MDSEILKSYLISLGFRIDDVQYAKFQQAIINISKTVERHTTGWGKQFATAAGAIATSITAVSTAVYAMMDKVAKSEIGYKKFALQMYLNVDAARRMKIAMDALGESIEDIAWIPELRERYFTLQKDQSIMGRLLGPDVEKKLRQIRDIRFEFTRLWVVTQWGMRGVTVKIFETLFGSIDKFHQKLTNFVNWARDNLDRWTSRIAQVLSGIVHLGITIIEIFNKLWSFWNRLPAGAKVATGIGGIIGAILLGVGTMPVFGHWLAGIGLIAAALASLLLIIDDYYTYTQGGKSFFEKIWKSEVFKEFQASLSNLMKDLNKLLSYFTTGFDTSGFEQGMNPVLRILTELVKLLDAAVRGFAWLEEHNIWKKAAKKIMVDVPPGAEIEGTVGGAKILKGKEHWYDKYLRRLLPGYKPASGQLRGTTDVYGIAKEISAKTGVPVDWLLSEFAHETGGFQHMAGQYNFSGIGGLGHYHSYSSPEGYIDEMSNILNRLGAGKATTLEEYNRILKQGGYYGDTAQNYLRGMESWMPMAKQMIANAGDQNNVFNITVNAQTNASPEEIGTTVFQKVSKGLESARLARNFSGVYD